MREVGKACPGFRATNDAPQQTGRGDQARDAGLLATDVKHTTRIHY